MNMTTVILLNGFAAAGKSTIARKYINDNPLSLVIEGDELIINIGRWLEHEDEARSAVFTVVKAMVRTYLQTGHSVILPYFIADDRDVNEIAAIASECGADFNEFVLRSDQPEAIRNLKLRGTWGKAGLPLITTMDASAIEALYRRIVTELESRPQAKIVTMQENNPQGTYNQLVSLLRS